MDNRLGRIPMKYDARDYRMLDFMSFQKKTEAAAITKKLWNLTTVLDQGQKPHCVGFAWAHYGLCEPVIDNFTAEDGDKIYYEAKVIDGEPNQETGSTTRSGAQAMKNRGRVNVYAFANGLNDIIQWLLINGPVVTGTDWTEDMFNPDGNGFITPTGQLIGGHEYLIVGVDKISKVFTFVNSWGDVFGKKGFFYMRFEDYQKLFNQQGDACVALELPLISTWKIDSQTESQIVLKK